MFWNAINTISSKDEEINVFCDIDNLNNLQSYQNYDFIDFKYLLLMNYFKLTEFLIFNVIPA